MNDALIDRKKRALTLWCRALLVASPFLLLGVVSLLIGQNAFAANPVWSNELDFWRNLYSWQNVGLQKGFSGMYEALPAAGTLGVTGVTPILLYGAFVKLFGLSASTILWANAAWISLAALVFCLLVKPKAGLSLLLSGLLTLYTPIALYCVTSMTELFDYALMLFYLAFLTRYYRKRGVVMLVLCFVTLALGCVYRGTYAVLLIPLALAFGDFKINWKTVLFAVLSLGLVLACYMAASRYTAPSVQKFTYHFLAESDLSGKLRMLMSHGKANLMDFFRPTGSLMQDGFRALYCAVMGLCLLGAFVRPEREDGRVRLRVGFHIELFCCFGLLLFALGFVVAFFETSDWHDFRLLAPFLWLVLGLMALRRRPVIPVAALAASLVMFILLFAGTPEGAYQDTYRFQPEPASDKITVAAQKIPYDPDAKNPLTNTVRTDLCTLQVQRELHPGLGLQYGWFTTETTGKSYWILTDQLKCVVEGYELVYSEPRMSVYRLIEPYEVAQ